MLKKKNGFTLIEVLAVMVILAVVILIAIPTIVSLLGDTDEEAFVLDAKGVIKDINTKKLNDISFIPSSIDETNISNILKRDSTNYQNVSVIMADGRTGVIITGKERWEGLTACGTESHMITLSVFDEEACIEALYGPSLASRPEMTENMIPVRWNGTVWVKADTKNESASHKWYDYNEKMWANAVTVTSATRNNYKSAALGTTVNINDILTFFVWVPRYKYAFPPIDENSGPQGQRSIRIIFEDRVTAKSTGDGTGTDYYTHPAFTFGTDELNGIWVGKFATASLQGNGNTEALDDVLTKNPIIKPTVQSWRNIRVAYAFTVSRNMQLNGNIYGFPTTGIDVHMMKNMEWGAVAFLSHSKYGTDQRVWKNPSDNFTTGCAGDALAPANTVGCLRIYSTANGVKASTTGNIYGIYDMYGVGYEYVMGNYNKYSGLNDSIHSGFNGRHHTIKSTTDGVPFPDEKYYDLYLMEYVGIKGDATTEDGTEEWEGTAYAVDRYVPWITRMSPFRSTGDFGNAWDTCSFRVVIAPIK